MNKKFIISGALLCSFGFGILGDATYCKIDANKGKVLARSEKENRLTIEEKGEYQVEVETKAKSYALIDANSGRVLAGKNMHEKRPIASMTKMMTMLLTLEEVEKGNLSLNEMVQVSEKASKMEGSKCFLDANENYTVVDLIKSIAVASANDSAVALAEKISGTEKEFARLMNKRAKEVGMLNTNYHNSTGLDEDGHYSTAYDSCLLLKELKKHDLIANLSKTWTYDMVHPSGRTTFLTNTNRLVRTDKNLVLAKTGHTDEAGYCITSYYTMDNLNLLSCVMGLESENDRIEDLKTLNAYAINNYKSTKLITKGDKITEIKIKGVKEPLALVAKEDVHILTKKGEDVIPQKLVDVSGNISLPIQAGETLGTLTIIYGNNEEKIDLVSAKDAKKQTIKDITKNIIEKQKIFGE